MSLKDRFDRFIDYFTEDEDSTVPYHQMEPNGILIEWK